MTFGEKLQKLRTRAGLSQDQLAKLLDVSRQAVSKWERNEAMPEVEKLVRISRQFGVSTDYLLLEELEEPETVCCTGTCCLRTSSCGVSLYDVNLAVLRILIGTVCQLTGQSHGIQSGLSPGEVSCLSGCLSGTLCQNRLLTDGLCNLWILL